MSGSLNGIIQTKEGKEVKITSQAHNQLNPIMKIITILQKPN